MILNNTINPEFLELAQQEYQNMCVKSFFLDMMIFVQTYQFEDFTFEVNRLGFEVKEGGKWFSFDEFFQNSVRNSSLLDNIDRDFQEIKNKYCNYWNDIFSYQEKNQCRKSWYHFNTHEYFECAEVFGGKRLSVELERQLIDTQLTQKEVKVSTKLKV
jgi:hypothetical protein